MALENGIWELIAMPMLLVWMALGALVIIIVFRWNLLSRGLGRLHRWVVDNAVPLGAYRSLGWLLTIPIVLIGAYHVSQQVLDRLSTPDIKLVFGRSNEPAFVVINPSSKVAKEPKYEFLLYNLSFPSNPAPYLNLLIPTKILDFIRPGRASGPYTIKSVAHHGSKIEQGHHLFGHAQVECPDCERVHYYWVFVHIGNFGFYAEIPPDKIISVNKNLADIVWGGPDYLNKIYKLVKPLKRFAMENNI